MYITYFMFPICIVLIFTDDSVSLCVLFRFRDRKRERKKKKKKQCSAFKVENFHFTRKCTYFMPSLYANVNIIDQGRSVQQCVNSLEERRRVNRKTRSRY